MISKDSKSIVITQIKNVLNSSNAKRSFNIKMLHGALVQTGKVPNNEINRLCSLRADLDSFDNNFLCLIYMTLEKYNPELKRVTEYFTDLEISEANDFVVERTNTNFPLVFKNAIKTTENGKEYKFFISIQQLVNMSSNGLLKIVEGMQRETETIYYRGKIENHVAYSDVVARKIADSINTRTYHPTDDIKIHYIGNDYEIEDNNIVINSGDIVLIDGQHRVRGAEYAIASNPEVYLMFSVNLSFGSTEYAQSIIEQHEKRQPIKKQVLITYKNTYENDIFKMFSTDATIEKEYKFVDNSKSEHNNGGFVIKSIMIEAIKKYYKPNDLTTKERREISSWLVTFFDEFFINNEYDLLNFITIKKTKWNVCSYAYDGLVYLSKYVYDITDATEQEKISAMNDILSNVNFERKIESTNKVRECLNIIKEAIEEYERLRI